MRTLLPATLSGRLIATLLVGLLAAQVVAAVILLQDRATALYRTTGLNAAQRIAGVLDVLERLDETGRRAVMPALNSGPLRVALLEGAAPALPDSGHHGLPLRTALQRLAGAERPLEVAVRPRDGTGITAQGRLADGQWVRIQHALPDHGFAWPLRLLLTLLVLVGSVVALTLLAVRWLTRPLGVLAVAAEELGRDIGRPPLAEKGPVEVRRAAAAFNTMQTRLQSNLRERERTLAAISHDLRTPITRLRLRAELIDDTALRGKVSDDLAEMEAMTTAALDLLRGAHSDEPRQPVDLMALLASLQADAGEAGHDVTVQGMAESPYPGRPLALKRLLSNLVNNAVSYGGRAAVSVRDDPGAVHITVADDGPGIPEAELEAVLEPFHRLEGSRSRETGGVGLGLTVARDIARAHGGTLGLRNRPEGGLEATVTLPR